MYKFNNGQEMLDVIQSGVDLYCKEINSYVFLYNDSGSICFYDIDEDQAAELRAKQKECGEYWGAFLGWGGSIYDDPSYEYFNKDCDTSNLEICNECYDCVWEDVTTYVEED